MARAIAQSRDHRARIVGETPRGVTRRPAAAILDNGRGRALPVMLLQQLDRLAIACGFGFSTVEIVGHRYDAALDNAAQVIVESCAQDFMLVGQGFAGDEDIEADRIACGMPMVPGFTLSSNANNAPMAYQPLPFPVDQLSVARGELTLQTFPDATSFDFIGHDSPFTQLGEKRTLAVFEASGMKQAGCGVVLKSAGGDNYRALVQRYEDCGATVLFGPSGAAAKKSQSPLAPINGL